MNNPTQALMSAMARDPGGVAVVWCPDLDLRDWLIAEVEGLARPDARPISTASVSDAVEARDRMVLLVPRNERAVVEQLEGCRDQLLEGMRTQPVILFLLRDGDGRVALADAPGLSSWVRGSDVDPHKLAEIDVVADRARFEAETGQSVYDWLAEWRAGRIPRNGKTFGQAYWAALLEPP
jgi:hypothetical protein